MTGIKMSVKGMNNKVRGFSLIELMIVLAIIGIIAGIGYPSYTKYLKKAGRAEASALLLEVMERQEQYYRRNRSYTATLADLDYTGPVTSDSDRHVVTAASCNGGAPPIRCIELTATAQNKSQGDGNLTLDSRGAKTNWN